MNGDAAPARGVAGPALSHTACSACSWRVLADGVRLCQRALKCEDCSGGTGR